ncbi:hypothetical protein C8R43DRAFT_1018808 [Mycena crocata]|nr:hypothetical protein C8R43DRAFT_1018808 [Mycena crocata]
MLFGGSDDARNVKSDMIAVDLDLLTWWVVNVQGNPIHPIRPRLSASMVAINDRLFIFGGRDEFEDDYDPPRPPPLIPTYSIAHYTAQTGWRWQFSDLPAPLNLGYSIQATPVYNGQKILLMQGRVQNPKRINLSAQSTIFFHTQNHTFQDASTTVGKFPDKLAWYDLGSLVAGPPPPALPPAAGINDPDPFVPLPNFPPSAVIVGWIKRLHDDSEENVLVPEVWQYLLPPVERIRCLDLVNDFYYLERDFEYAADFDFHSFILIGNRLLLLGSKEERHSPTARLDIAVEISSEYLTE